MGLTMSQRQAVTKRMAIEYKRAAKKRKSEIINWLVNVAGYKNRAYAARVLRKEPVARKRKKKRKLRPKTYDGDVLKALKKIWAIYDCICGKRLVAVIAEAIAVLEKFSEIKLDGQTREKLLRISASSIDRLLANERKKFILKGKSLTKPGSLLKHQIPIRTFADWNEDKPGFVEIDLVGHDGGNLSGDFCQTLDAVDICTTWTETIAVKTRLKSGYLRL